MRSSLRSGGNPSSPLLPSLNTDDHIGTATQSISVHLSPIPSIGHSNYMCRSTPFQVMGKDAWRQKMKTTTKITPFHA